jgi:hypothetical protein
MTKEEWQELSEETLDNLDEWRANLQRMNRRLAGLPSLPADKADRPGLDPSSSESVDDDALDPNARLAQLMKETVADYGIRYGEGLIRWINEVKVLLKAYDKVFKKYPGDKKKEKQAKKLLDQVNSYYGKFYHGPVT